MSYSVTAPSNAAARAFDSIAEQYDRMFTHSAIGRAQRDAVWEVVPRTFRTGNRILELNCGTGEDAFFLSRLGMNVHACDASENMIAVARRRQAVEAPHSAVEFELLATEELSDLERLPQFDGVLSNFGGLNCLRDLSGFGYRLGRLVRTGGCALLCVCSRICAWELAWFLCQGKIDRAFQRIGGRATALLNGLAVDVHYPTVQDISSAMSPWFALRRCQGIGVTVPPSYLEDWARSHRGTLGIMRSVDRSISGWPGFRVVGDHILLTLERTPA